MTSSIVNLGPDSSMAADPEAAGEGVEMEADGKALLNLPTKENRVMKKAQRMTRNGGTTEAVAANGVQHTGGAQDSVVKHGINMTHKSHRRRRHARGRVQLKKGNCFNYLLYQSSNLKHHTSCIALSGV